MQNYESTLFNFNLSDVLTTTTYLSDSNALFMYKKFIYFVLPLVTLIVLINFLVGSDDFEVPEMEKITVKNLSEIPPEPATDIYGISNGNYEVVEGSINRNESLYIILRRHGVSPLTIHNIQQKARGSLNLNRMVPGQNYKVYLENGAATAFVWQRSSTSFARILWGEDVVIEQDSFPVEKRINEASGVVSSSLYNAIAAQGISQLVGAKLANIYGWKVDFFSLRRGDHFKVIYEEQFVNGEFIGVGDIIAAEFQHRGNEYRAYQFDNGDEVTYYDEEGNSMQRALLKAPFEYNQRISSHFSRNRMHPILNERRPHYGIDYAAPTGTPIIAVGDGVVTEAQRRGGNGNIVQIRHNSTYRTAYLHLSRFASGIRPGATVKQGQVIGYVGQTGLATGPHLCYRFYVNDQPVNSLNVDLPASEKLEEHLMTEFQNVVERYNEMIDRIGQENEIAQNI